MHLGPSVEVRCLRGGRIRQGRQVAGDLDIVPAHTASVWEAKDAGRVLVVRVPEALLRKVAQDLGMNADCIDVADHFQLRDPMIEHIGWALKADVDSGCLAGPLFRNSLGNALAARLLQRQNERCVPVREMPGGLSAEKLQRVVSYIEDNLESELPLADIAAIAGISVSHLKTLFRHSMDSPVHRYVLRRRVERAQLLLQDRSLSIAQIAFATGFAHPSHLARHMRKLLGVTPTAVRRNLAAAGQTAAAAHEDAWY